MKEILILVPHRALLSSIEDARYLFVKCNEFLKKRDGSELFHVRLIGLTAEMRFEKGIYTIRTDDTIQSYKGRPDIIIIPSLTGDMISPLSLNLNFNRFIQTHYRQGCEIAALCTGSFMLATTGLLKNMACSTHWNYANEFRNFFPDVQMVDDKVVTHHKGLYTSGGSTSYWNLLLLLLEKHADKEVAFWASKYFALDITRASQSPFAIFNGQKEHGDADILEIQSFIEENYRHKNTINDLTEKLNIGRRTFERRFRKATNNSILEYLQRVRIEAAKQFLEKGGMTVGEVMYEVGYTDLNTFRTIFRKYTAMSPVEYKSKYASLLSKPALPAAVPAR